MEKNFTNSAEIISKAGKLYDYSFFESMGNVNADFISHIKSIFIKTIPPAAEQLVKHCEANEWDAVAKSAHKLKSSVDTLNIECLKKRVRYIEQSAKELIDLESLLTESLIVNDVISIIATQMEQE